MAEAEQTRRRQFKERHAYFASRGRQEHKRKRVDGARRGGSQVLGEFERAIKESEKDCEGSGVTEEKRGRGRGSEETQAGKEETHDCNLFLAPVSCLLLRRCQKLPPGRADARRDAMFSFAEVVALALQGREIAGEAAARRATEGRSRRITGVWPREPYGDARKGPVASGFGWVGGLVRHLLTSAVPSFGRRARVKVAALRHRGPTLFPCRRPPAPSVR